MTSLQPDSRRDQFRRLAVLIALSFVDMLGFAIVLPILPFYALDLSATPETVGWLIASFSIAQLVAAPLWGRVSDRYGRRPALLVGMAASAFAFVIFGLASTLWMLFLSRVVQGAGGGTTGVAQAYVSDSVAPADRARALGWLSAATAAGIMIGPALGSLATHWGRAAPGLIAAALCSLNFIAAWRWLPESKRPDQGPTVRRPVWSAAWEVVKHPAGAAERFIWIYGVGMLAFTLWTSVLALWLEARFGVTVQTIGWFFVYNGLLSLIMRSLLLGPVVARLGETRAMQLGCMALAASFLLYPLAPSLGVLAAIIPLTPIGTALLFPSTTALLSTAARDSEQGMMMGVAQTFAGLSRVVAPVVGTIAYQRLGINAPFVLGGLVVGTVGWAAWRFLPAGRRQPVVP